MTVVFLPIPSDTSLERASPVSIAANIPPVPKCGKKHNCAAKAFYLAPKQRVGKSLSAEQLTENTNPVMLLFLFLFFFFSPFSLSRTIKPLLAGYYIFNM